MTPLNEVNELAFSGEDRSNLGLLFYNNFKYILRLSTILLFIHTLIKCATTLKSSSDADIFDTTL